MSRISHGHCSHGFWMHLWGRPRLIPLRFLFIFVFGLSQCSFPEDLSRTPGNASFAFSGVKVLLVYNPNGSLSLNDPSFALNETSSVTRDLSLSVEACRSGYTTQTPNANTIRLYRGDKNCIVKLVSFKLNSVYYNLKGSDAQPFTSWEAGDTAIFESTVAPASLLKVTVMQQIQKMDSFEDYQVIYAFEDVNGNPFHAAPVPKSSRPSALASSLNGESLITPQFTLLETLYITTNEDGSASLSFTFGCNEPVTGSDASNLACQGLVMGDQLDYVFVPDTFSQRALAVDDANQIFAENTSLPVKDLIFPGKTDNNNNVVANGGFYTQAVQTPPLYPDGLDNLLVLRRQDPGASVLSYYYVYVELPRLQQD